MHVFMMMTNNYKLSLSGVILLLTGLNTLYMLIDVRENKVQTSFKLSTH